MIILLKQIYIKIYNIIHIQYYYNNKIQNSLGYKSFVIKFLYKKIFKSCEVKRNKENPTTNFKR